MRNVVLHHIPRGGSSMVAHIFAVHGFACENSEKGVQKTKDGTYGSWEWVHLKEWRNANRIRFEGMWEGHKPFRYRDVPAYHRLLRQLPEPWVAKDYGVNAHLYDEIDCVRVGVLRDAQRNARSMANKKGEKYEDVLPRIQRFQQHIVDLGCPIVLADDVVRGDYSTLHNAAAHAGFKLDPEKVRQVVDPEKWHYWA